MARGLSQSQLSSEPSSIFNFSSPPHPRVAINSTLPLNLITHILELSGPSEPTYTNIRRYYRFFKRASLVCKLWRPVAQRLLWRYIELGTIDQALHLLHCMDDERMVVYPTSLLLVTGYRGRSVDHTTLGKCVIEAARKLTGVKKLVVLGCPAEIDLSWEFLELPVFSRLKSLEISSTVVTGPYPTLYLYLHLTSLHLSQYSNTHSAGYTVWSNSPLTTLALHQPIFNTNLPSFLSKVGSTITHLDLDQTFTPSTVTPYASFTSLALLSLVIPEDPSDLLLFLSTLKPTTRIKTLSINNSLCKAIKKWISVLTEALGLNVLKKVKRMDLPFCSKMEVKEGDGGRDLLKLIKRRGILLTFTERM